jgi:hypothetical protein
MKITNILMNELKAIDNLKAIEKFTEIMTTYLSNYSTYEYGKVIFECDYGELIFIKEKSEILNVFSICIIPEYRKNGLCRNILHYLIDNSVNKFKYICVQSVLSKILYEYLLRFNYKNKKFKRVKDGFIYKI